MTPRIGAAVRLLASVMIASGSLFGAYSYYYTDSFATINKSAWTVNGAPLIGSAGLRTDGQASLISTVAVPGGSSDYEVRITPGMSTGSGAYDILLRATPDALSGWPVTQGSAYVFRMEITTYYMARLDVYRMVNGSLTVLGSMWIQTLAQLRAVVSGSVLAVYSGPSRIWITTDGAIPSGQPGVQVEMVPDINGIRTAELGPPDRIAPNPVASISASTFPNPCTTSLTAESTEIAEA